MTGGMARTPDPGNIPLKHVVTIEEAADHLNISRQALSELRSRHENFPAELRSFGRHRVYDMRALEAFYRVETRGGRRRAKECTEGP